jgi:hypothetical protein
VYCSETNHTLSDLFSFNPTYASSSSSSSFIFFLIPNAFYLNKSSSLYSSSAGMATTAVGAAFLLLLLFLPFSISIPQPISNSHRSAASKLFSHISPRS